MIRNSYANGCRKSTVKCTVRILRNPTGANSLGHPFLLGDLEMSWPPLYIDRRGEWVNSRQKQILSICFPERKLFLSSMDCQLGLV